MIAYCLRLVLCSAVLWVFYKCILQSERMFNFNRFFLLLAASAPIVMPLVSIEMSLFLEPIEFLSKPNNFYYDTSVSSETIPKTFSWLKIFIYTYAIGFLWSLRRMFQGLYSILFDFTGKEDVVYDDTHFRLLDGSFVPYVFFKTIYVSKNDYYRNRLDPMLIEHERTHIRQLHSLDVLFIEILKVIFWFNPFYYLLGREIKLNHEFLADDRVLRNYTIKNYQRLLLDMMQVDFKSSSLASNLHFSLTKKRIIMMTKKSTSKVLVQKKVLSGVFVLLTLLVFANYSYAQSDGTEKDGRDIQEMPSDGDAVLVQPPTPPAPPAPPAPPTPVTAPEAPAPPPTPRLTPEEMTAGAECYINGTRVSRKKALKAIKAESSLQTIDLIETDGKRILNIRTEE